jgi:hypothetical protein
MFVEFVAVAASQRVIAIATVTNPMRWVFAEALAMQMQMQMEFATMSIHV